MEPNELLPDDCQPPPLTGKARAKARSENWKCAQNAKFIAKLDEGRNRRLFPGLSDEEIAEVERLYAEIKERELLDQERLRQSQDELVQPTIADQGEYQHIELPTNTVPLDSAVDEIHSILTARVGPGIEEVCPISSFYRFSSCQLLYYVDPHKYQDLHYVVHSFQNFALVLKCIQLNSHYVSDEYSVHPKHDDYNIRSSTIKSADFFRKYVDDHPDSFTAAVVDGNGLLFRKKLPSGALLPPDYTLDCLALDAKRVQCLLRYVLPFDSEELQPRLLTDRLLPYAPYLAFMNQIPVDNLNRRVIRMCARFPYFNRAFDPDLRVTCYYRGSEVNLLTISEDCARRMSTRNWLGNFLSSIRYARRHSAYEDDFDERGRAYRSVQVDW